MVVNTCFIIFRLTGNVFSNLFPISVDTSPFGSRRTKTSMNRCSRQHSGTERAKSVMWEIKYVPREKRVDGMFPWIFRIFTRAAFTLYLLRERIEFNGIFFVPNLPRIASRKNLISCIVLSSPVLHGISGYRKYPWTGNPFEDMCLRHSISLMLNKRTLG